LPAAKLSFGKLCSLAEAAQSAKATGRSITILL
jgi:hypothetical protein